MSLRGYIQENEMPASAAGIKPLMLMLMFLWVRLKNNLHAPSPQEAEV